MGIIEYRGITFTSVEDLIRYQRMIEEGAEQPEPLIEKPIRNTPEKIVVQPKIVAVIDQKEKRGLAQHSEFIKSYYGKYSRNGRIKSGRLLKLAKRLKVQPQSITNFVNRMGLRQKPYNEHQKVRKKRYWTDSDINVIKRADLTTRQMAEMLKRTPKAIGVMRSRVMKDSPEIKGKIKRQYMTRKRPIKPLSYEQRMIKAANWQTPSEPKESVFMVYPLARDSMQTLLIMLKDAAQRGTSITYDLAQSNLSLLDDRPFTAELWQDIISQIIRQSHKLEQLIGVKITYLANTGSIRASIS